LEGGVRGEVLFSLNQPPLARAGGGFFMGVWWGGKKPLLRGFIENSNRNFKIFSQLARFEVLISVVADYVQPMLSVLSMWSAAPLPM
jgi:hypothetical protein